MAKQKSGVIDQSTPTEPTAPITAEMRPATHREDPLLDFKQVARLIGIHSSTVARWATQMGRRRLKTVRLPSGRRKVRQSVVNQILAATGQNGDATEKYEE